MVGIYRSLSDADNIDWFIPRFSLSWTILVVIYPWFVCHEQNWLVYHPDLSVMDNKGWYFSQFFFCRGQKLVGISTGFVCHNQK